MVADLFLKVWERHHRNHPFPLHPDAKQSLEKLAGRYILFMLTSRGGSIYHELEHHGIRPLFTEVCTLLDCEQPKPHPLSMNRLIAACEVQRISSEHVTLIGDSAIQDWELARRTGFRFYAVTWGYSRRKDFRNLPADQVCDSFSELVAKFFQ